MRTHVLSLFSILFILLFSVSSVYCATFTSTIIGNWNSSATWGGAGIPGVNDVVFINTAVDITTSTDCTTLTINSGGTLTLNDNLHVSGTLSGDGTLTHQSNQTLTVGGDFTITTYNPGSSGTLNLNGTNQNFNAFTFNLLNLSGNGIKTVSNDFIVGILTIGTGSTLDMSNHSLSIAENQIMNSGTIKFSGGSNGRAISSGTIEYYGSTQTIEAGNYSSLIISNSGDKTIGGLISTANVTVANGSTLIVNSILSVSGLMTVNGTLKFGTDFFVDGSGAFTLANGATIEINSVDGITSSGATGNIRVLSTRTYNSTVTYTFIGSALQNTGNGLPTIVNILNINNGANVKLSNNLTATTSLNLINGCLFTNTHLITANATLNNTNTSFIVTSDGSVLGGSLIRNANSSTIFPIGPATGIYMPLTISGSGSYTIGIVDIRIGLDNPLSALTYSWDILGGGPVNLTFQWPTSVQGSSFPTAGPGKVLRFNSGWTSLGVVSFSGSNPNSASIAGAACCSEYTLGGLDALPIVLNTFTAIKDKQNIRLNWSTASEKNNDHFSIERSNDGFSYKEIGVVKGAGNTLESKAYQFIDDRPLLGNDYYRLKQVDFDGAFSYSDVRVVNMDSDSPFSLYPTLVRNNITLHTSSASVFDTDVELISVTTGAVLYKTVLSAGSNGMELDLSGVPPGSYVARLEQNQVVFNHLFLKQ